MTNTKSHKEYNIAFVDWQNLHLGITSEWWELDFKKFRIYIKDKFKVQEAYYFIGYVSDDQQSLYSKLQKAWFIVIFREHSENIQWKKKWNVDTDIVFDIMRNVYENKEFDKIVLVSGDWDYIKPVKRLISKWLFKKILFPNKKYSSLYRQIQDLFGLNLSTKDIVNKLIWNKNKNWK